MAGKGVCFLVLGGELGGVSTSRPPAWSGELLSSFRSWNGGEEGAVIWDAVGNGTSIDNGNDGAVL